MNKTAILIVLVTVLVLSAANDKLRRGKGGNRGKGTANLNRVIESRGGEEAVKQNSLKAGDKNLEAYQGLLQKKAAKEAKLARRNERKARKKQAARAAQGEKLQAEAALDFETYDKKQNFHNLEAAADRDVENSFGLQLMSENRHTENAAIKENGGAQASSGTKLAAREAIDAAQTADYEALDEGEYLDQDLIDAAEGASDAVNAQEASKSEREAFIDTQNFNARSGAFNDGVFGEEQFGTASFPQNNQGDFFGNNNNIFDNIF